MSKRLGVMTANEFFGARVKTTGDLVHSPTAPTRALAAVSRGGAAIPGYQATNQHYYKTINTVTGRINVV